MPQIDCKVRDFSAARQQGNEQAKEALSYARASLFEREAVSDERAILREALRRGMGETREHFLSIASYTTYALSIMLRKRHKKMERPSAVMVLRLSRAVQVVQPLSSQ